jgi:SAM-dependent methyltransferase
VGGLGGDRALATGLCGDGALASGFCGDGALASGSAGAGGFASGSATPGGFANDDLERLAGVEDGSFWFRGRNALLLGTLESDFPGARSVLEVGCGNGYVLAAIAERHPEISVAGVDLGDAGLREARRRIPRATLIRADVRELPYEEEFDVVGAFDVIEHVRDDEAVLAAMHRAVRPGGGIVVSVPQHEWLWSETDRYAGHERRYTRRELAGKLERTGFRLRWATSFVTLLLPAMVSSRVWQAVSRRRFDPSRELAVDRRADAMMERIMRVETRAIGLGMRFPVGGSLLAVAERV